MLMLGKKAHLCAYTQHDEEERCKSQLMSNEAFAPWMEPNLSTFDFYIWLIYKMVHHLVS